MRVRIIGLFLLIILVLTTNMTRDKAAFGGEGLLLITYIVWMIYDLVKSKE